jgi:hypothetical protein
MFILVALIGGITFFSTSIFAQSQSKNIAKMYEQLDSLENRKLELKRENDSDILNCLKNDYWKNLEAATGCRLQYAGKLQGVDWGKATEYRNEICECYAGKKHEIEAVETQIKQLERRIDLLKYNNTPTQNVKK